MSLHDWADIFLIAGAFVSALSAFVFFWPFLGFGTSAQWIAVSLLRNDAFGQSLRQDLKNPEVAFGGLLGLIIKGSIAGFTLLVVGGLLWLV